MLKLLASNTCKILNLTLANAVTLPEKTITTKMNDSVCLPLKYVSGSDKSRLDHDGNQQRSIANVQNDGL